MSGRRKDDAVCHREARNGTARRASLRRAAQAGRAFTLRSAVAMSETFINLGPYAFVRVELLALSPTGPYRLTTEHPARRLVEYFDDAADAIVRREQIETTFGGSQNLEGRTTKD